MLFVEDGIGWDFLKGSAATDNIGVQVILCSVSRASVYNNGMLMATLLETLWDERDSGYADND